MRSRGPKDVKGTAMDRLSTRTGRSSTEDFALPSRRAAQEACLAALGQAAPRCRGHGGGGQDLWLARRVMASSGRAWAFVDAAPGMRPVDLLAEILAAMGRPSSPERPARLAWRSPKGSRSPATTAASSACCWTRPTSRGPRTCWRRSASSPIDWDGPMAWPRSSCPGRPRWPVGWTAALSGLESRLKRQDPPAPARRRRGGGPVRPGCPRSDARRRPIEHWHRKREGIPVG